MTAVSMPASRPQRLGSRSCIQQDSPANSRLQVTATRGCRPTIWAETGAYRRPSKMTYPRAYGSDTRRLRESVGTDASQVAASNLYDWTRRPSAWPGSHTLAVPRARVCVETLRERGVGSTEKTKPQDGAPSAPRGRGLRPRRDRTTTTTIRTLEEYSSSSGRKSPTKVLNSGGGLP